MRRRRFLLQTTVAAGAAASLGAAWSAPPPAPPGHRFSLALNAATIRGHRLPLADQLRLAAAAGYAGYEPWVADLAASADALPDLARECRDRGLRIVSAIGFAKWIVDDPEERAKGLEQMKRDMDLVRHLGGQFIAAPPAGATQPGSKVSLDAAAERYAAIVDIGQSIGVTPQLEIWGASATLSRLDEAAYVLARCGRPEARLLADAYHIYKGGSAPAALRLFGRSALACFHINDYPAAPPRDAIRDADRIWPGHGIAPLGDMLRAMADNGADVALSLELFNADYWKLPAVDIARIGLEKMRRVLQQVCRS